MRKFSILSGTIGLLLSLATLQATEVMNQGLFGGYQVNGFNYATEFFSDTQERSARDLEYQGDGINQRSYYSFTTTGVPTYPILGSSSVFGFTVYVPVYTNPEPTSSPLFTGSSQQLRGPAEQASAYDTQSLMLVNQILDNTSSTSRVNWMTQSENPYTNPYGLTSGSGYGLTGSRHPGTQQNLLMAAVDPPQAQTLLQHDAKGQTFVNSFSADMIVLNGGLVTISQIDAPEPATAALLALGLTAFAAFRVRRKHATA